MIKTKNDFLKAVKDKEFNYNVLALNHAHYSDIINYIYHEGHRMQGADEFSQKEYIENVRQKYIEHFCMIEKLFNLNEQLDKDIEVNVDFKEKGLSINFPKVPNWYDELFMKGELSFKIIENITESWDESKYESIRKEARDEAFNIGCNNLKDMTDDEKEKYFKRQSFFKKLDDLEG